jgi:hypothetical protein
MLQRTRGDFDGDGFEEDDELSWRFLSLPLDMSFSLNLNGILFDRSSVDWNLNFFLVSRGGSGINLTLEILKKYGLDNEGLRKEWLEILVSELQLSFIPKTPVPLINQIKRRTPKRLKQALRKLLRTLFAKPKRI